MIEIKISIYQINSDRDKNNMLFMSHDTLEKYQGYPYVDSSIYDKIYQKDVDCKMLETVFNKFNIDRPSDFKGHSLSVSDIIEVVTSNSVEPGFYFCDRFGFKKVEFDPDKTQVSAKINTPKPMIDVLTDFEHRVLINAFTEFRNDCLENDIPTDDVDEIYKKILTAPTKKDFRRGCRAER